MFLIYFLLVSLSCKGSLAQIILKKNAYFGITVAIHSSLNEQKCPDFVHKIEVIPLSIHMVTILSSWCDERLLNSVTMLI